MFLLRAGRAEHEPVGQCHVVGPHVELEPLPADDAAEDGAGVDADPHVDVLVAVLVKLLDGSDHAQPHPHAVVGVVLPGLGTACAQFVVIQYSESEYLSNVSTIH